ncbi:hypothetical protein D9M72_611820 [compost metagenome]
MVWAGSSPRLRLSRARRAVARPAMRSTNTPNIEPRMISSRAGKNPMDPATLTNTNSSNTGNSRKSNKKGRIKWFLNARMPCQFTLDDVAVS